MEPVSCRIDATDHRILRGLSLGLTRPQIGKAANCAKPTVDARIEKLKACFGAAHTPHLVYLAVKNGTITPNERPLYRSTPRQKEILKTTVMGKTPKEVAETLGITKKRVNETLYEIRKTNGLRNWIHLAAYADQLLVAECAPPKIGLSALTAKELDAVICAVTMTRDQLAQKTGRGAGATRKKISNAFEQLGKSRRQLACELGLLIRPINHKIHLTKLEYLILTHMAAGHVDNSALIDKTKASRKTIDATLRGIRKKAFLETNAAVAANAMEILMSSDVTQKLRVSWAKEKKSSRTNS